MKKVIVTTGIVFLLLFAGMFWGCETKVSNKDIFAVNGVLVAPLSSAEAWQDLNLKTTVNAKYLKTIEICKANLTGNHLMANTCVIPFPGQLADEEKITKCKITVVPLNIDVTSSFQTLLKESLNDFTMTVNDGFFKRTEGTTTVEKVFGFKEEPTELKGKDIQFVFSVETVSGKVFADTTEVVHLNW